MLLPGRPGHGGGRRRAAPVALLPESAESESDFDLAVVRGPGVVVGRLGPGLSWGPGELERS